MPRIIRFVATLAIAACVFTSGALAAAPEDSSPIREAMESAIAKVKPALVRIHVVSVGYSEGREVKEEAYGSGAIITKEGHVITNHHVAGNATYITCSLANNEELEADLVGTDPLTDLSVIKIRPTTPRTFPLAEFGDSDSMKVGDRVFAMGSPLAFSQSVTMGVISNTQLVMPDSYPDDMFTMDGEDVGSVVRWIAHDAAIYPGNSGGPLVDQQGKIVGINEIEMGLSGAIPGNLAHSVAEQIIKNGKVSRSWMGFFVQPSLKGASNPHGVLITGTLPGSPAQKAGIKLGDVLTQLNGQAVDVHYKEQMPPFNNLIMGLPVGKPAAITVVRGGKELEMEITPVERPGIWKKPKELKEWGMVAGDLSSIAAMEFRRKSTNGVRVRSLRTGGPAESAKPALEEDDIITEVGGKPVHSLSELRQITATITAGKTEPVPTMVGFDRNEEHYLTVVRIGIEEDHDRGRDITKSWVPVGTQVLTHDLASALGLGDRTGVRVTQIYPNSAAQVAGLQVGDIITALDGNAVEASDPDDTEVFPTMVRQYHIGSKAVITLLRDGKEIKVPVQLPAAPKLPREMRRYRDRNYDFAVRDIAFRDRIDEGWSDAKRGAIVETVGEGGWAALGRLSPGDLITAINGQPVIGADGFAAQMKATAAKHPRTIVLRIERGIRTAFVEMQASWPDTP